jgi:hypothetical protein
MTSKEELEQFGYTLSTSQSCPVENWGKWQVLVKKDKGPHVAGYGVDENLALEEVLKTIRKLEEILKK